MTEYSDESVLFVGGYGVVGRQIAHIFRHQHPTVPIILAGRNPEKAELLARDLAPAETMRIDLNTANPFADLGNEKPRAIVQVVNDPQNVLLHYALKHRVPLVDITRWTSELKTAESIIGQIPEAPPIILSSAWMAGLVAVIAGSLVQHFKSIEKVDIDILYALQDKAGPNSIEYIDRLNKSFDIISQGQIQKVSALSDPKGVAFSNGYKTQTYRFDTPEQYTLPKTLRAASVNTRIAYDDALTTKSIRFLVRSGLWALISADCFTPLRHKLLFNPGSGAAHEIVIEVVGKTAEGDTQTNKLHLIDPQGQTHLTSVGAVLQLERILTSENQQPLVNGINWPEAVTDLELINDFLVRHGVMLNASTPYRDSGYSGQKP
ncbi:MAG: hypothetical protein MI976_22530 [Pseudomonadales bacterium]|nr:hypothetical protein [Pseudomonadales bacterium]